MTFTRVVVACKVTVTAFLRHVPFGSASASSAVKELFFAIVVPLPAYSCTMMEHRSPKVSLMRLSQAEMT